MARRVSRHRACLMSVVLGAVNQIGWGIAPGGNPAPVFDDRGFGEDDAHLAGAAGYAGIGLCGEFGGRIGCKARIFPAGIRVTTTRCSGGCKECTPLVEIAPRTIGQTEGGFFRAPINVFVGIEGSEHVGELGGGVGL